MAKIKAAKKLTKKLKEYLEEYADFDKSQAKVLQSNVQNWLNKTPKERTEALKDLPGWYKRSAVDPIKAFKVDSPKASLTERASVPDVISSIKKGDAVMKKGGFVSRRSKPRGFGAAKRGFGRAAK